MSETPHPRHSPRRSPYGLILVAIVIVALLVIAAVWAWKSRSGGSSSSTAVCTVTTVAHDVQPAVVTISANGATGAGTGSGEVIRSDGYILTNNHVISQAADGGSVEVTFANGATADATITGRDPATDLAVLKVDPPYDLNVIDVGTSSDLQVGQPVVALGAPLGLSGTVTSGIVSALDRDVTVPSDNGSTALLVAAVQTDAAINPGNSGGALVDCNGDLIGVPTAGAVIPGGGGGSIGLGFAIPVDQAIQLADEIIDTGKVTHAYLGMTAQPVPPEAASQAGTAGGLFITSVTPGGPAAQAGLQQGDIITQVNGSSVSNITDLQAVSLSHKPGAKVDVTYERGGTERQATVTLGER